jgi:uncharacterized membrane protein
VWVIVTFITKPEPEKVLLKFYRDVRPDVAGWKPLARLAPDVPQTHDLARNLFSWVLGCAMVYMTLFGLGYVIFGAVVKGVVLLVLAGICAWILNANLARSGWEAEKPDMAPMPLHH